MNHLQKQRTAGAEPRRSLGDPTLMSGQVPTLMGANHDFNVCDPTLMSAVTSAVLFPGEGVDDLEVFDVVVEVRWPAFARATARRAEDVSGTLPR
jgi:hypothetical protein